jgi:hypothetical protein
MNETQLQIITNICRYWDKNPSQRFTQVLQNLEMFEDIVIEDKAGNNLKFLHDNYYQKDEKTLNLIANSTVIYDLERTKKS